MPTLFVSFGDSKAKVNVTPNTSLATVLESACSQMSLSAVEHILQSNKKDLDLSLTFRLAGLQPNSTVQLVPRRKALKPVEVLLQREGRDRVSGKFLPVTSLWDVILDLDAEALNLNPVVSFSGRKVEGEEPLKQSSLLSLGLLEGQVLLRLQPGNRLDAAAVAASAPPPTATEEPEGAEATEPSPTEPEPVSHKPETVIFHPSTRPVTSPPDDDLGDDFFALGKEDYIAMQTSLKFAQRFGDGGMARGAFDMKAQFQRALVRVRFASGHCVQREFDSTDTVADINTMLLPLLDAPGRKIVLYTTPPIRDLVPAHGVLGDLGLAPAANVYVRYAQQLEGRADAPCLSREAIKTAVPFPEEPFALPVGKGPAGAVFGEEETEAQASNETKPKAATGGKKETSRPPGAPRWFRMS